MYKLGCRDMGVDCDFVAEGETQEEVMQKGMEHGKEAHGMTDMTDEQRAMAMEKMQQV